MIKEWPGWANFGSLLLVYFLVLTAFDILFRLEIRFFSQQRLVHCLLFCGAYLAKWRFFDGSWHFDGNFVAWLKSLWGKLFK